MKTFLIADTHFQHTNIIKYCDRPYTNVEEMEIALIKNWNSVVGPNDLIIVLGDFTLSRKADFIKGILDRLNGRKWLIMGNHDRLTVEQYYEVGFEYVSKFPIVYNSFYILSHEPLFMTENMPFMNIYGHVHNNPMFLDRTENTWCVSVERINYTPVEFVMEKLPDWVETPITAQSVRKDTIKDQVVALKQDIDKRYEIEIRGGRIFVVLYLNMRDGEKYFNRVEFSTTKTDLQHVVDKIKEVLDDEDHPFSMGLHKGDQNVRFSVD